MHPAFSIIFFTTLSGAAQGIVVALAAARLAGVAVPPALLQAGLGLAAVQLVLGLGASFLHLGRPERAWRTVMMWRTSWMSREVIVLPAFLAVVAAWWLASRTETGAAAGGLLLPLLALVLAALLWVCTAMIYACLRFIQEWAHPLTLVNYTLIGLASGLVQLGALAAWQAGGAGAAAGGASAAAGSAGAAAGGMPLTGLAWAALAATLAAWATRGLSLRRNAALRPRSTAQSATGIPAQRLVQTSMGMTGGSFNTREFFHGATHAAMRQARTGLQVLGFAVPAVLLGWAVAGGPRWAWGAAVGVQAMGVVVERWFFFAEARHPQNLYYQRVS